MHKRTPSQTDIAEFKDLTKKDALIRLQKNLSKLVLTASPQSQKVRSFVRSNSSRWSRRDSRRTFAPSWTDSNICSIDIFWTTSIKLRSIGKKLNRRRKARWGDSLSRTEGEQGHSLGHFIQETLGGKSRWCSRVVGQIDRGETEWRSRHDNGLSRTEECHFCPQWFDISRFNYSTARSNSTWKETSRSIARLLLAIESCLWLWCAIGVDEFVQYSRRNRENPSEVQSRLGEDLQLQSIEVCSLTSMSITINTSSWHLDIRVSIVKRFCPWRRVSRIPRMNVGIHQVTGISIKPSLNRVFSTNSSTKAKNTCFSATSTIWAQPSIFVRRVSSGNLRSSSTLLDILKHLLTDQTKHEFLMEVTDKTRADVKVNDEREKDAYREDLPRAVPWSSTRTNCVYWKSPRCQKKMSTNSRVSANSGKDPRCRRRGDFIVLLRLVFSIRTIYGLIFLLSNVSSKRKRYTWRSSLIIKWESIERERWCSIDCLVVGKRRQCHSAGNSQWCRDPEFRRSPRYWHEQTIDLLAFDSFKGVNVPRRRFLPVKTTSDLLLVMSNLFTLNRGNLVMNVQRSFPSVPLVKLGTSFIKVVWPLLVNVRFTFDRCLGERLSFAFSKYPRLSGIGQSDCVGWCHFRQRCFSSSMSVDDDRDRENLLLF